MALLGYRFLKLLVVALSYLSFELYCGLIWRILMFSALLILLSHPVYSLPIATEFRAMIP